ncbi:hypothetical protein [Kineosporia sp. NBRC 101731]|uniref:hypothetical protein n=1 Tax=Kineosporia sp. NBRC 101731 TaxID=3032199 RepID=UPI0024A02031|nr:hypothetical protein [Kineosporia sp. NBRC 101731]GLY31529.1 hypothetical protein Kisp02_48940 [Kineosporia sp. NBRC 101731]
MSATAPRIDPARFADPDSAPTDPVTLQVIRHAVVISTRAEPGDTARMIASRAPEDHENTMVVLDLPRRVSIAVWESVAAAIGPGPRGIRLIIDGRSRDLMTLAAGWLSERLDRPVTLADGPVVAGPGVLLVGDRHDHRWRDYVPGHQSRPGPRRFPRPIWDDELTALIAGSGPGVACEPLPAGAWIRPETDDAGVRAIRNRLLAAMPMRRAFPTLVLGLPGARPLPLEEIHRLRSLLPETVRRSSRMAGIGPIALPPGKTLAQALADLSGEEIYCYTGIPVGGTADFPDIRVIAADGRPGPWPYALEMRHRPVGGLSLAAPDVTKHRPPFAGLTQVGPGAYQLRQDAVIEVIQSGLLLRPVAESPQTTQVRRIGPDERQNLMVVAGPDPASTLSLQKLAESLMAQFDEAFRKSLRIVTAEDLMASAGLRELPTDVDVDVVEPLSAGGPAGEGQAQRDVGVPAPMRMPVSTEVSTEVAQPVAPVLEPVTTTAQSGAGSPPAPTLTVSPDVPVMSASPQVPVVARPAPAGAAVAERGEPGAPAPQRVRFQPLPARQCRAVLPSRPIDEERTWLRTALGSQYGTLANAVARTLSEHPGFEGFGDGSAAAVGDAVAVRLYLSPEGPRLNPSLRVGADGPHVPFARCIVAGLGRLPSHRGPASFSATVGADAWELYENRPQITEWGFLAAGSGPADPSGGDTDVLIWSLTGRRTALLDSFDPDLVPRVLFVPGTRLKVLETNRPAGDARGSIMMREITARDLDTDPAARTAQSALDEMALASLRADLRRWSPARASTSARRPGCPQHPLDLMPDLLPGLVRP